MADEPEKKPAEKAPPGPDPLAAAVDAPALPRIRRR